MGKDRNCSISLFAFTKCKQESVYHSHAWLGQMQYLVDKVEQISDRVLCSLLAVTSPCSYQLSGRYVPEGRRASTFGILSRISSSAFVCGTLFTQFVSTPSMFQVAISVAVVTVMYMRVFLPDSIIEDDISVPLLSNGKPKVSISDESSNAELHTSKALPSIPDFMTLLKTSPTFSQAAIIAFFSSLADVGLHASLLYYLKAWFHFNKDQFADLMVISGGCRHYFTGEERGIE